MFMIWFCCIFVVEISLEEVKRDWLQTSGQYHIRDIAQHYGVYQHLFGDAYFVPRVPLDVKVSLDAKKNTHFMILIEVFGFQFKISEDLVAPVYFGNTIKPSEAKNQPSVCFDSAANLSGSSVSVLATTSHS